MRKFKFLPYLLVGLLVGCLFPIQSLFAEQPITLIINGKTITNASPQIVSDRTYVPLRVISEELNAKVEWDGENRIVRITSRQQGNVTTPPVNTVDGIPTVTPEKDNPKLPVDSSKIENKPQNNTPQYINGDIDANGDGTPDWVTSESDIFERMNQDAPRMN
jgi:hypothetical protein